MIRIHVRLIPLTPYNISSGLKTREKVVLFNFGVDPTFKFVPPTTIKGVLRTGANYAFYGNTCETVTAKILVNELENIKEELKKCEGVEKVKKSFTCSELQRIRENNDCESMVYSSILKEVIDRFSKPCIVCRVFGNENVKAKARIVPRTLKVNTFFIKDLWFSYNMGESEKGLRVEVSNDKIEFIVLCEDEECKGVTLKALEEINRGSVRLGKFKSRGFGIIKAQYEVV